MAHVLVVGGGVSGLSAGIFAALDGHRVTVCEQHHEPGGNLTGWHRGGFHIDNCIHWLTGTRRGSREYEMWEKLGALGAGVRTVQPKTLYTCEYDGESISLYPSIERTEREMLDASLKDKKQTRELISAVRAAARIMGVYGQNEGYGIWRRLCDAPILAKYCRMSTGKLAAKFKSELLRRFIISFFGEDFGAIALIVVFATFATGNGAIPAGGSRAMARRMADRLRALGGELMLGKCVERIDVDRGRAVGVRLKGGERIAADHIVIAAEPFSVFGRLVDIPLPNRLRRNEKSPRLRKFSSFHCAFGCSTDDIPFDGDLVLQIPDEYRSVLNSDTLVLREFSHEPSFAHEGRAVVQAMIFCEEESSLEFIKLAECDGCEYKRLKDKLALTVEYLMTERFPELRGRVRIIDSWTPATYKRYTGAISGSYMAYALPPAFLPRAISPRVPGVKNLFIASQWQRIPGGLPGAATSGRAAAQAISARERQTERSRGRIPRRAVAEK